MNWFRLKACVKCLGDLVWDDGDWLCLQCGRYYYARLYQPGAIPDWQWDQASEPRKEKATVLSPVLLHSYRGDRSEPVEPNLLGFRTAFSAADACIGGKGFGNRSPAMQ